MPTPPRPLTSGQLEDAARLWAAEHGRAPWCAGGLPLPAARAVEDCWGVEEGGRLVGVALGRRWGRVAHVHGMAVAPEARGRGLGGALLDALADSLVAADAAVVGADVDHDLGVIAFFARHRFRPAHPTLVLERPVAAGGARALEPRARIVSAPVVELADRPRVAALAAALDADLDPSGWIERLAALDAADVLLLEAEAAGAPDAPLQALAVLPKAVPPERGLAASLVLADDGPPFPALRRVVSALDAIAAGRGLARTSLAVPGRYYEPLVALLELGYRPASSFLRMTLRGHPERADPLRPCLATWR